MWKCGRVVEGVVWEKWAENCVGTATTKRQKAYQLKAFAELLRHRELAYQQRMRRKLFMVPPPTL